MVGAYVLPKSVLPAFESLRLILLLGLFLWMAYQYLGLPREQALIKILFQLRNSYRFFFELHPLVPFLAFAFHGVDANLIYWNSIKNSANTNKFLLKTEFVLLTGLLGVFYLLYEYYLRGSPYSIGRFLVALFLTHYVIEGLMYRMGNPITRSNIAPLLR